MRILFFYQHFWPDSPPYANMLRTIGAGLAGRGHTPCVLTAQPSYKASDRAIRSPVRERLDGIEVRRLPPLPLANRIAVLRTAGKALFPLRALLAIVIDRLRGRRPDVIVAATIPPVVNGLCGLLAARLVGARFIYHMQDIYPEIGAAGGLWAVSSRRYELLLALDTFVARHADRCIVLSSDMRDALVARGLTGANVVVLNNFMLSRFDTEPAFDEALAEEVPLADRARRRVVFAGNLGRFQGLDVLLEAFLSLDHARCRLDLHFLGDGAMGDALRRRSAGHAHVHFHGHLPFDSASRFVASCDAGIVSIGDDIYRYAYPSKTLTYLGLGVPLFVIVEPGSSLASEVVHHRLGVVADGRSTAALASAFEALDTWLASDDADRERIASYAESAVSPAVAIERWVSLVDDLEGDRQATGVPS